MYAMRDHGALEDASSRPRVGDSSPAPRSQTKPSHDTDFTRTTRVGRLWNRNDPVLSEQHMRRTQKQELRVCSRPAPFSQDDLDVSDDPNEQGYVPQLKTRPIDHLQLVAEVKGIYAGLVMVESKCIEADNAQDCAQNQYTKLNNEQWQALIALHRTLLHEHHDFLLAPQHPTASGSLRRLGEKYYMPGRKWKHGVRAILEPLKHHLPSSLEHCCCKVPDIPPGTGHSYPRRRGRGTRRNNAYWKNRSQDSMPVSLYRTTCILSLLTERLQDFFRARDCLFADSNGKLVVPALADLDSGLRTSGPTDCSIISPEYAKHIGRFKDMSTDFEDPRLRDVSGNPTPMKGIMKDVAFRLKGCSETFRHDFYVSDLLGNEGLVSVIIMFGTKFMQDHFASLFQHFCTGATFVGNEIKSGFTQILNSGSSVEAKVRSLLGCVRSNAGKFYQETASSACSGFGSWAVWGTKKKKKKKQNARELKEREKQQEAQRLHSARLEWGRRAQEAAAHDNNAGPQGKGPIENPGSSQASSNAR